MAVERHVIQRLGHQGDGIAPGPVFVPGVLPGEEVEGEVTGQHMARPKILAPVEARVSPPCRHAKSCGGCQLQHAAPDFTAGWKVDVIGRALQAHGLEPEIRPIVTSPPQSRRRARFSARRTKKGALAGFHQKGSDVIVAVPDCILVTPALAAALPMVEELAVLGASRKGELSVLVTETLAGLDVHATGGKPLDGDLRVGLAALGEKHDLARISWEDEALTRRPPHLAFGTATVVPPPGAFLQPTPEGADTLIAGIAEALEGAKEVADLFAGCGTFALPLAGTCNVHAVEGDRAMTAALDEGWRKGKGLRRVTTETRDLFRNPLLPDDMKRYDGVVIDPPRAGAEAQVTQIAAAQIPRVAHVSCNPVTFARDCATLVAAGYSLEWVQPLDQFRWSTHVECVASLRLGGRK